MRPPDVPRGRKKSRVEDLKEEDEMLRRDLIKVLPFQCAKRLEGALSLEVPPVQSVYLSSVRLINPKGTTSHRRATGSGTPPALAALFGAKRAFLAHFLVGQSQFRAVFLVSVQMNPSVALVSVDNK